LRASGRLKVRTATAPSRSKIVSSAIGYSSSQESAVNRYGDGRQESAGVETGTTSQYGWSRKTEIKGGRDRREEPTDVETEDRRE
jgi:hypothetical protein